MGKGKRIKETGCNTWRISGIVCQINAYSLLIQIKSGVAYGEPKTKWNARSIF